MEIVEVTGEVSVSVVPELEYEGIYPVPVPVGPTTDVLFDTG